MCDEKYILDFKTLEQMKSDVFNKPVEVCALLAEDDIKVLTIDNKTITLGVGKQERQRASCSYTREYKGNYIYHSHPNESRSYPSSEDIVKVLKTDKLRFSIIATRWGVYIIKPTNKSHEIASMWSDRKQKYYMDKIKKYIDKIGIMENDKGYKEGTYDDIYPDEEELVVEKNLEKIRKITFLRLKFCTWRELNI